MPIPESVGPWALGARAAPGERSSIKPDEFGKCIILVIEISMDTIIEILMCAT